MTDRSDDEAPEPRRHQYRRPLGSARDVSYIDDPLVAYENQAVRRTVDDVNEINKRREFWLTAKSHTAVALKLAFALPVTVVATIKSVTVLLQWMGKWP